MEKKSIFKSKTFWFGICQILLGAAGLITGLADQQTSFALITTGLASIGLRFTTTTPVSIIG